MKTAKVTRILHSQGLHQAKCERLTRIAALCGRVRADAWQRCSGLSTAQQSAYEIRNAWMAEGYDWHGLPAPMSSSRYRHRGTNRRLSGWVKGIMADTLTSISRRRGS
ncbi:MAG: hypothetical protein J4G06_12060, partial [Caldilineaceae bacterium]|nr:hypothetical protein [Caldilineaceae bacterium]